MLHPALRHEIVNSPNPNGEIVGFPNGAKAKLVLLGNEISIMSVGGSQWWPTGGSDQIRRKMLRRIVAEGLVLPIVLATNMALLSEMYTTTSSRPSKSTGGKDAGKPRVRLSYNRSPIADFGIVAGSAPVKPQDRLAYYNLDQNTFLMGQDPEDHYWMYFTTLAGEEQFLECNMYTFNFCLMVDATPYTAAQPGLTQTASVPGFFFHREFAKMMPLLDKLVWKPRKRFSVLRDPRLQQIASTSANGVFHSKDLHTVYEVMQEISGRECSAWEKAMMQDFLSTTSDIVAGNVAT